jgi:hypothetical protein
MPDDGANNDKHHKGAAGHSRRSAETHSITLNKGFRHDYEAMLEGISPGYQGSPYAFVRFGDGEGSIIYGQNFNAKTDGWEWRSGNTWISQELVHSISAVMPDYHVGITCEPCNPAWHHKLMEFVETSDCNVTFAELFYFANYRHFKSVDISRCCVVGAYEKANIQIPTIPSLWTESEIEHVVRAMLAQRRPMLIAAGPMACILIHDYWRATRSADDGVRQTVIDVGSAIDERFGRFKTRKYQWMRLRISRWSPKWKVSNSDDLLVARLRKRRKR